MHGYTGQGRDSLIDRGAGEDVLKLDGVSHAFGDVRVLDGVNIDARPGELLCLLGPSGCGKTTALRLAAGIEELQQGRITLAGQTVAVPGWHVPPERRSVGMVFQDYALFPHLSVLRNVQFGLGSLDGAARRARAFEALDQVGMAAYAESYPHMLSGGQQQRVALARALAPKPRVLLLDEPFSGLDSNLRAHIRDETLHVVKDSGTTTLIVTHDPEEAMYMADRIVVMNAGRVEQIDRPETLYNAPANAFVATFFSSINRLEAVVRSGVVATPFGSVAAPGLPDGRRAEVLIRPEALRVSRIVDGSLPANAARAHVLDARMLRRASFIHLCFGEFDGQHLHFHSREPGRMMPSIGDHVAVTLERSQTFVFPIG